MGIFRLLAIVFVIWLIMHFSRRILDKHKSTQNKQPRQKVGRIVKCTKCGLHIPEAEAIKKADSYYCCQEHLEED